MHLHLKGLILACCFFNNLLASNQLCSLIGIVVMKDPLITNASTTPILENVTLNCTNIVVTTYYNFRDQTCTTQSLK